MRTEGDQTEMGWAQGSCLPGSQHHHPLPELPEHRVGEGLRAPLGSRSLALTFPTLKGTERDK